VLALKGTAALWSPKVLRAGMGAHFGLRLVEGLTEADLAALACRWWAPVPHAGPALHEANCRDPAPGCWGTKGRACQRSLLAACALRCASRSPGAKSR
jgi:TrmH family RNA methyltransferase